jgi:hypothetical protein
VSADDINFIKDMQRQQSIVIRYSFVAVKLKELYNKTIKIIFYSSFLFENSSNFLYLKEISDGIINKSDILKLKIFLNGA